MLAFYLNIMIFTASYCMSFYEKKRFELFHAIQVKLSKKKE